MKRQSISSSTPCGRHIVECTTQSCDDRADLAERRTDRSGAQAMRRATVQANHFLEPPVNSKNTPAAFSANPPAV
jgi:hypothetical protein